MLPTPPAVDEAAADRLRSVLSDAGYSERSLSATYGPDVLRLPRALGAPELLHRVGTDSAQAILVRLFLAGRSLPREAALDLLGASAVAMLEEAGLLAGAGTVVSAPVSLTPLGELLLAHDRVDAHGPDAKGYVVGPGPPTRHLSELAISGSGGDTLDLGCGQGALALQAASDSGRVIASDLCDRAVGFCTFNTTLNAVSNVDCRQGDLFAPVRGVRFERIFSNPPYVVSPSTALLYRDGRPGLCERIVREAPRYLNEGGTLQMLLNWPEYRGRDWRDELLGWFAGSACDAWLLRDYRWGTAEYAGMWLRQVHTDETALAAEMNDWMAFYETAGIDAVYSGAVILRKVSGREPWREIREMPAVNGAAGDSIARTLEARDAIARLSDDEVLLNARLRPSPDLVIIESRRPGGEKPGVVTAELRLARGLELGARVDPLGAALIRYLDGRRSVREALGVFAAERSFPIEAFERSLPGLIRSLARLGLLLPA